MYDINNIAYLPLDIESPPLTCLDYLNKVDLNSLLRDDYRNCYHVPLMLVDKTKTFNWTHFADLMPELKNWCYDVLFPITGHSRIMIITTPPGQSNPPHIDCSPGKFHLLQHKIRYVLQGNIGDLIFLTKTGDLKISSPVDKPFVMSGKWPHYMTNNSNSFKFTLAFGSPWDANISDFKYTELLYRSIEKYKNNFLSTESKELPTNYKSLFENIYNGEK